MKKRFSYQLLSEVAQDRGVQRLLHGRVFLDLKAGDQVFNTTINIYLDPEEFTNV